MCSPCKPLTCKLFYLGTYLCLIYVILEFLELLWLNFHFKYLLESKKIVKKKKYLESYVNKDCWETLCFTCRQKGLFCLLWPQARPQSAWRKSRCKSQDWWICFPFSHVILEKNLCGHGPSKQVKCDDLQGWDGGGGMEVQEGDDMCVYI